MGPGRTVWGQLGPTSGGGSFDGGSHRSHRTQHWDRCTACLGDSCSRIFSSISDIFYLVLFFEGREKNCKKHITTCDMRCNSDPWLHSKLKRNHNLRFSFIFLYHFQNCNIAINFEYCVKSIVKPLAKESLLNVSCSWLCYGLRYISMQNSFREGVNWKNRFFLGNSPKQRTPPAHRYSLGLT